MVDFEKVKYTPRVDAMAVCPKCGYQQAICFPDAYRYIYRENPAEAGKEISGTVICPKCKVRLLP